MKIVYASTQEQENEIRELVMRFYRDIFPLYFSDDKIQEFERTKVLTLSAKKLNYHGTMKEAYAVIASLQTLISILESADPKAKYEWVFYNNAQTLNEYGIHFPFSYEQFTEEQGLGSILSVYAKAANQLLV